MPHRVFYLPALLFLLSLVGCSKYVGVDGTVKWSDGSPLTEGTIIFEGATHSALGDIQKDGTFKMGMVKPGEGMPPGDYKVTIAGGEGALVAPSGKPLYDPKFANPKETPLTATVVSGKNAPFEFTVARNPELTPQDDIPPPVIPNPEGL